MALRRSFSLFDVIYQPRLYCNSNRILTKLKLPLSHFCAMTMQQRDFSKRINENADVFENEILYGRSVCNIALKASRRPIFKLHLLESFQTTASVDARVLEVIKIANQRGLPTSFTKRRTLDSLSNHRPHQGVCLEVGELMYTPISEQNMQNVIDIKTHSTTPLWVMLCGVLDPMNLGAILRSCFYLNVERVIVSGSCAPLTPVLSKASSGAAEIFEIFSVENSISFIQLMIKNDWDIIGTAADQMDEDHRFQNIKKENVYGAQITKPSLLVMGSEGFGIPSDLMDLCTRLITIQPATCNSVYSESLRNLVGCLNVSNAAAIILHQLTHGSTK